MSAEDETRVIAPGEDMAGIVSALIAALILENVSPSTVERAVARARSLDVVGTYGPLVRAFANEQANRLASSPD